MSHRQLNFDLKSKFAGYLDLDLKQLKYIILKFLVEQKNLSFFISKLFLDSILKPQILYMNVSRTKD